MKKISKITILAACFLITPGLEANPLVWLRNKTHSYFASLLDGNRRAWSYTLGLLMAGLAIYKADASAASVRGPGKPQQNYEECALCLENLIPEQKNIMHVGPNCIHMMHKNCVQTIKDNARTKNIAPICPLCKASL